MAMAIVYLFLFISVVSVGMWMLWIYWLLTTTDGIKALVWNVDKYFLFHCVAAAVKKPQDSPLFINKKYLYIALVFGNYKINCT